MTQPFTPPGTVSMFAPAKINLFLHVLGRRDDGYHMLQSLVAFCDVGDRLHARHSPNLTLSLQGPFAAALADEPDNLVLRAARLLAEHCGVAARAQLVLEKNLPVASGIGGGSSDAAAALLACARLWGVEPAAFSSADLADGLGADVPACLAGVKAGAPLLTEGIGEALSPAPALPPAWTVLANPGTPLATAAVFAARQGPFGGRAAIPPDTAIPDAAALARLLAGCRNDLTAPALSLMPDIADVLAALEDAAGCLLARLSGSGPTCFGLFADGPQAEAAALYIRRGNPAWWVRAAPLLSGKENVL